jgi:hypothetical protein
MLNLLLSHWMTYIYLVYVVLLIVFCVAFRPRATTLNWKLYNLRARGMAVPIVRRRHFRWQGPSGSARHF